MNKHKVRLTIAQQNKFSKYQKVKLLTYYEIIDDPQKRDIEMCLYMRLPVRILCVLLSPFAILVGGVPLMVKVIKECLAKTEVGAYTINRQCFYKTLRGAND